MEPSDAQANAIMFDDGPAILEIGEEADARAYKIVDQRGWYEKLNEKVQSLTTIKTKEKVTFFQLLAIMLGAGVPLTKSLYVLAEQNKNVRLRVVIRTMADKVESGKTFSEGMADFHGVFNDAQIGMVRAGEESGQLNDVLKEIAMQAEKADAVARRVKGALIYPAVVFTMMGAAVLVILGMVVPQITQLFTQTGTELPMSTQLLIGASDLVRNHFLTLVAVSFMVFGGLYVWKRQPSGKYYFDYFLLRLPVIGLMLRYVALSRFTRSLSSLLSSGIPIVRSLEIDAEAVGNAVYRRRILLAAEDVSQGIPLAENLMDSKLLFPEMVVSMIGVGEQTAELSKVSGKIADYYEDQVDQMANNMSKLLEPIIMAVMGIVVGGLIIAVMQPIFSLMDVVGNV